MSKLLDLKTYSEVVKTLDSTTITIPGVGHVIFVTKFSHSILSAVLLGLFDFFQHWAQPIHIIPGLIPSFSCFKSKQF